MVQLALSFSGLTAGRHHGEIRREAHSIGMPSK